MSRSFFFSTLITLILPTLALAAQCEGEVEGAAETLVPEYARWEMMKKKKRRAIAIRLKNKKGTEADEAYFAVHGGRLFENDQIKSEIRAIEKFQVSLLVAHAAEQAAILYPDPKMFLQSIEQIIAWGESQVLGYTSIYEGGRRFDQAMEKIRELNPGQIGLMHKTDLLLALWGVPKECYYDNPNYNENRRMEKRALNEYGAVHLHLFGEHWDGAFYAKNAQVPNAFASLYDYPEVMELEVERVEIPSQADAVCSPPAQSDVVSSRPVFPHGLNFPCPFPVVHPTRGN